MNADWFNDGIENLNLYTNYVYVLQLVEDRYYIGRTTNIFRRIEEHFTNNGSIYTKNFKPIKVIEVVEEKSIEDERYKTLEYMEKYGWERVRGSYWCSLEISQPKIINKNIVPKEYIKQEIDDKIIELYCIENLNIIEIGMILNINPNVIANRLQHNNIIERLQLSRGYIEYITSDTYKEKCKQPKVKNSKIKKIKNKNTKKIVGENIHMNGIKENLHKINLEMPKSNILDIKNKIRQLICSVNI
jgi:predicted GIY-YIG superfamily endonuclease